MALFSIAAVATGWWFLLGIMTLQLIVRRLRPEGRAPVLVDVSKRPDVARAYHVAVVPAAFTVDENGRVLERIA